MSKYYIRKDESLFEELIQIDTERPEHFCCVYAFSGLENPDGFPLSKEYFNEQFREVDEYELGQLLLEAS